MIKKRKRHDKDFSPINPLLIKALREINQLKLIDLGKYIKTNPSYLHQMEEGKVNITFKMLERYSKAFKIPTRKIIDLNETIVDCESYYKAMKALLDFFDREEITDE